MMKKQTPRFTVEVFNAVTAESVLSDHDLKIKKNVILILLRNIDPQKICELRQVHRE